MSKIDFNQDNEEYFDVLREIGNVGASNASAALAQLLGRRVEVHVPKVKLLDFQEIGKAEWKILEKYPVLTPLAFIYGGIIAVRMLLKQKGGWKRIIENFRLGRRRKKMFSQLYGEKTVGKRKKVR